MSDDDDIIPSRRPSIGPRLWQDSTFGRRSPPLEPIRRIDYLAAYEDSQQVKGITASLLARCRGERTGPSDIYGGCSLRQLAVLAARLVPVRPEPGAARRHGQRLPDHRGERGPEAPDRPHARGRHDGGPTRGPRLAQELQAHEGGLHERLSCASTGRRVGRDQARHDPGRRRDVRARDLRQDLRSQQSIVRERRRGRVHRQVPRRGGARDGASERAVSGRWS